MNNVLFFFRISLVICFVFCVTNLSAQEFNAELISQKTEVVVKNNKLTKKLAYELVIYNRRGAKYTDIEIPFSTMNKVSNINAYIKTPNGQIIKKLKKDDIKYRSYISSFSFYEDHFIKEFTLKYNQYPFTFYYEYEEKQDEFLYVDYWTPILDLNIPTKQAKLSVTIPKDYGINFNTCNTNKVEKDSIDNCYTYQWAASYDGKLEHEYYAPSFDKYIPSVAVVPNNFKYDTKGSFNSWKQFGLWQHNLIQDLLELPSSEIGKINSLVYGMTDTLEIVKTLYHYLQDQTRYINITIETGGLKPYPASYVAQNKYGDCKALSNYFKAVLKTVDIDAFYCKIHAGGTIEHFNKALPSQQTNHIILCVPISADTLWLDCTSDEAFGYVGTFIQNREVFVINNNNSFFTKTPNITPEQILEERYVTLELTPKNETFAELKNTYRGKLYEALHSILNQYNEIDNKNIIRDNLIATGFEPLDLKPKNSHRDSTFINLSYSATSNEVYKIYGRDLLIKLLAFDLPKMELPENRFFPVQIDFPIYKRDTLKYTIPLNYKLNTELPDKTIQCKYGTYKISHEISGNQVRIFKSVLIKGGQYPTSEYNEFYDFMKSITQIENNTFITAIKNQ